MSFETSLYGAIDFPALCVAAVIAYFAPRCAGVRSPEYYSANRAISFAGFAVPLFVFWNESGDITSSIVFAFLVAMCLSGAAYFILPAWTGALKSWKRYLYRRSQRRQERALQRRRRDEAAAHDRERRLEAERWERERPDRDRDAKLAEIRVREEAALERLEKDRVCERESIRFQCQTEFDRLRTRLPENYDQQWLETYFRSYLNDSVPPTLVKDRALKFCEMLDAVATGRSGSTPDSLGGVVESFQIMRSELESLDINAEQKELHLATLAMQEAEAIAELIEQ